MSYRYALTQTVIHDIEDDTCHIPDSPDDGLVDFWAVHQAWIKATKEHAPPSVLNRYSIWCMAHLASKAGL